MNRQCLWIMAACAACVAEAKQINSIVDLAHSFSFYADGRFSSQYTPGQPWARNLASFKALDLPNANANLLLLSDPQPQAPFTEEDCALVKAFAESGGLVVMLPPPGKNMFGEMLATFGIQAGEAVAGGKVLPADALKTIAGSDFSIGVRGRFSIFNGPEARVFAADAEGNPVVIAVHAGEGYVLVIPRGMISEDPGSRDRDYNAEWVRPLIEAHIVKEVPEGSHPRGRDFTRQDFRETLHGVTFHYSTYLAPYYAAMKEIVQTATPLIEKRMGVPLAGENASEVALLATGGGGFSSGPLIALAVFWENFPARREGMIEFLTHESTHSWVLPFPEVWNEPIATYVGDLVMMDAGYPEEGTRRIQEQIRRAARLDPGMTDYGLDGAATVPGARALTPGEATDLHWGKTFWILEELRKENPAVLADYFQAKRRLAVPGKIKRYGINETVAVMSFAMKRDLFGWFAQHGIKADRAASEIKDQKEEK